MVHQYLLSLYATLTNADLADFLGIGSVQATVDPSSAGKDDAFWNALNEHVKNLHAIISGHGG